MKFTYCIALFALTLFVFATDRTGAKADTRRDDISKIRAAYAATDAADEKQAKSSAFACVTYDDSPAELAAAKAYFKNPKNGLFKTVILKIDFTKAGATVYGTQSMSGILRQSSDHSVMCNEFTFKDYWVDKHGTWLQVESKVISQVTTINGKPYTTSQLLRSEDKSNE